MEDNCEVWEVERILAEKREQHTILYLVKWVDYADEQCTWEPAEHFTNKKAVLALWRKCKSIGDVLYDFEIEAVQKRMDRFQRLLG